MVGIERMAKAEQDRERDDEDQGIGACDQLLELGRGALSVPRESRRCAARLTIRVGDRDLIIRVDVEDATRRTRLAAERTYLAWLRSGLTALAVALAAGKLVPELSGGAAWPYELLGIGYALLGIAMIAYGHRRQQAVEEAVRRGEWAPLDPGVATVLTVAGVALGAATIVVVLFASS
jgi:putative membrane protein